MLRCTLTRFVPNTAAFIVQSWLRRPQIFLIAQPIDRPAFLVEDANRPDADFDKEDAQFNKVLLDTRLNNRVLDLRVRGCSSHVTRLV